MYTLTGHTDANDQLLRQHARLVKRISHQLKARLPASVELDDLIQAGMMGLMDAIQRYEAADGAQFETYATQRIRGAMLDELRRADWLPRSVRRQMREVESAMQRLEQQLGRTPSEAEIAAALGLAIADYHALLAECSGHQLLYYEDYGDGDEDSHFLDRFQAEDPGDPMQTLLSADFRSALSGAIEALPEREKLLMGLYYEQELTLKEIGAVLGVTESRVCQLHSQAVARLRSALKEKAWTGAA